MISTPRGCDLLPEGMYSEVMDDEAGLLESIHMLRPMLPCTSSDVNIPYFAIRQTHILTAHRAVWLPFLINNAHRGSAKHSNAERSSLPSNLHLPVSRTSRARLGRF